MIDESHPLLLGSASPRRLEILRTLGLPVQVVAVDVDEACRAGELPDVYLERVIASKLAAVAERAAAHTCGALLVADTIVLLGRDILGKPCDRAEAARMLRALSGNEHEVWTRFAVSSPGLPERALRSETVRTRVVFRELRDDEIERYAATGEGLDKAGAYAIQGVGAFAVARVVGSYSCVVGLPACEVVVALRDTGLLAPFPRTASDAQRR
jgi:septum formation protein